MSKSLPTLNNAEFAALCGVSAGTITNWADEGMPCERQGHMGGRVAIDLHAAIPWVIHSRAEAKPGSQRERLAKVQADKVELDNARRRGQLLLSDQVAQVLAALGADLAARHDGLAGRIANELAGINDAARIRERLLDELRHVRGALADATEKLADALGSAEDTRADPKAAARKKPKRMGRPVSRAAARKRRARTVEQ